MTCSDPRLAAPYDITVFITAANDNRPWSSLSLSDDSRGFASDPDGSVASSGSYLAGGESNYTYVTFPTSGNSTAYVFNIGGTELIRIQQTPVACE